MASFDPEGNLALHIRMGTHCQPGFEQNLKLQYCVQKRVDGRLCLNDQAKIILQKLILDMV